MADERGVREAFRPNSTIGVYTKEETEMRNHSLASLGVLIAFGFAFATGAFAQTTPTLPGGDPTGGRSRGNNSTGRDPNLGNRGTIYSKEASPHIGTSDSEKEKSDAKTAADATDVIANSAAVAAAGVLVFTGQAEVSGPVALVAGVLKLTSSIFKAASDDPPRSDFRQETKLGA